MLRFGIGAGLIIALCVGGYFWLQRHDAETYQRALNEIARKLQQDAAEKERAAIEAENEVTPTPSDPAALAALCNGDPDCRDRKVKP